MKATLQLLSSGHPPELKAVPKPRESGLPAFALEQLQRDSHDEATSLALNFALASKLHATNGTSSDNPRNRLLAAVKR